MQTNLIQIRNSLNVTQKQLADFIGVDVRTYINKEQGISQFKCNEMFAISYYFKKDVESIFLPSNFMNREVSI